MHQIRLATSGATRLPQARSLGEVSELLGKLSAELKNAEAELERVAAAAPPPQPALAPAANQSFENDVKRAKALRMLRRNLLGTDLYSGSPFEILLHLYESHLRQLKDSITSLTEGAGLPLTTTMRWTDRLEAAGLILVYADKLDARRRYVHLSPAGADLMNKYFVGASTHLIAAWDVPQYWKSRYVEAMLTLHGTDSDEERSTYLKLAKHYRAMAIWTSGRPPVSGR